MSTNASGTRETDGHVTSVERNAEKLAQADNLHRAGLRNQVTLLHGDATKVIATLPGQFDFVFFDADRVSAPAQGPDAYPILLEGSCVPRKSSEGGVWERTYWRS